jgi:hypothetical protein
MRMTRAMLGSVLPSYAFGFTIALTGPVTAAAPDGNMIPSEETCSITIIIVTQDYTAD